MRGFTPCRAARGAAENLPKPVKLIESPVFSVVGHGLHEGVDGLARVAVRLSPLFAATLLMNSCFVKAFLLSWVVPIEPQTLGKLG